MGFSAFKNETRLQATTRSDGYDREYQRKALVALERRGLGQRYVKQYLSLTGAGAGDLDMRQATAANSLACATLRARIESAVNHLRATDNYGFHFGTIIHEPWHTSSYDTIINLADMERRVRNVVRMCGFAGAIIKLETQAVPGKPADREWEMLPHAHFLAVVETPFNKRKAGERVRGSNRLSPPRGVKSIKISKLIDVDADLCRRSCYLAKEPYSGKKIHSLTGKYERTIRGMHPEVCLRLTEVNCFMLLSELVILTGAVTNLRQALFAPVHARKPENSLSVPPPLPARFWDTVRAEGEDFYPPIQIIRKAKQSR